MKSTHIDVANLTDEDILKMSDNDYMNQLQLEYFRNKLLQLEQEILEKRDLEKLNMLIKANEIYYYIAINNLLSVKQILNIILTDECSYNFNLITIIYRFF